jgi:glucose-1-phosphate thymidylyltransferase
MYLGDNLVKGGVADVARDFAENDPNCQIMLSPVANPSAFGVADVAPDGSVRRLVEKPSAPPSDLALVGVYLFDATIAEAVRAIEPSARGELEITDAIQYLIDTGKTVRHSIVNGWWKDTGTKEDLLAAQHLVIAELSQRIEGEVIDSEVTGSIHLGANSRIVDSEIIGPVVIGVGVEVARSRIGPETSIGDECAITDSTIERSIVMGGSVVAGWRLRASIIGRGTTLRGTAPRAFTEMMLGEHSEITES